MEKVLFYIDESKPPTRTDKPILVYGRMFRDKCRILLDDIVKAMLDPEVVDWHDSSFVTSKHFRTVLQCLNNARYCAESFVLVQPYADYETQNVADLFDFTVSEWTKNFGYQSDVWDFSKTEQRALFHLMAHMYRYATNNGLEPTIVFDLAQSDFKKSVEKIQARNKGFIYGWGPTIGVNKKITDGPMSRHIPWLNLIDGELWMFQRFQHMELNDKRTIWQRAIDYRTTRSDGPIITEDDWELIKTKAVFNPPREAFHNDINERFCEYIASWIEWIKSGQLVLLNKARRKE